MFDGDAVDKKMNRARRINHVRAPARKCLPRRAFSVFRYDDFLYDEERKYLFLLFNKTTMIKCDATNSRAIPNRFSLQFVVLEIQRG